jgi:hypothetical protein
MTTTEVADAMAEALEAAEGAWSDRFLDRLVERVGGRASVKAVFGDPIERGDLTVVPVARVRWGFGGGGGSSDSERGLGPGAGAGGGGGGGVVVDPIGYLEIRPDGATFERIIPPLPSPLFVLASGLTAAIVLRALSRLLRR